MNHGKCAIEFLPRQKDLPAAKDDEWMDFSPWEPEIHKVPTNKHHGSATRAHVIIAHHFGHISSSRREFSFMHTVPGLAYLFDHRCPLWVSLVRHFWVPLI